MKPDGFEVQIVDYQSTNKLILVKNCWQFISSIKYNKL